MSERDSDAGALFGETYPESRAKFLLAAAAGDGRTTVYVHPDAIGPDGGSLTMDVAVFGSADASRAFLILSGTHGGEGYTGSAAQIALMETGALSDLPPDVKVVLVHAINPYGFAHWTRTTEHNVDLNRNFIDFAAGPPANPGYEALHPYVCPDQWTDAARTEAQRQVDRWIQENGQQAWIQAIMMGQYDVPTGLNYGGTDREWSNRTLERIVGEHLAGVEKLAFIDWHTGLGDWAEPFFLCFNEYGGPAWERACGWWGRDRIETKGGFAGAERPKYSGLIFNGVEGFVAPAEMTGAVIEFGTLPLDEAYDQLRIDRWLKYGDTSGETPARLAEMRRGVRDGFTPPDPEWRRRVVDHAREIQLQGLRGLCDW